MLWMQFLENFIHNPQNIDNYEKLNNKLRRYCNDFLTTNIQHNEQSIRIHPNHSVYHYDILVNVKVKGKKYIFFVSFNTGEIASLIKRTDIYLSTDEEPHILSSQNIKGTQWKILDIYHKNLFTTFKKALYKEESIIVSIGEEKEVFNSRIKALLVFLTDEAIKHEFSDTSPYLTLSAGSSSSKDSKLNSVKEHLEEADDRLYKAKEGGRNRLVY
ncbi:MAG: hypothetical protein SPLUMA2_SPLUMAMAG2_00715 [uncultured Sulfurimonas sp.]|nr:MAG: hypothetical protein SPLUMA2_SPLUMAMAG2_00715 [uncultured Sulfurimonas sp.]